MIDVCERQNGMYSTVFACLTRMWKHMVSVCNCYCCGDHDSGIIVLYTPITLHCWKVLFIYLWVCEDASSTSGLILYPQRNRLFFWYRLDFIQQSGPQALLFTNSCASLKRKRFKMCHEIPPQNLQYNNVKKVKQQKNKDSNKSDAAVYCGKSWDVMLNSVLNYFKQHFQNHISYIIILHSAFMTSFIEILLKQYLDFYYKILLIHTSEVKAKVWIYI